jgi:alpha-L-fucosidase
MTDKTGKPIVWEACITLNDHWGYGRDDKNFKSPAQVVRMLVECVSKGGNLLLNVGPTAYGEIQPECVDILHRVGHWMHLNGASIYGAGRAELPKPEWGYYTRSVSNPKRLFAHVMHRPVGPIPLLGLASQAKKARLVADGSEVSMARPWNVVEGSKDTYLHLPHELPDGLDTVVEVTME